MARLAVVLFNLGGPDSLASVEPFLFNLFNDPAIIRLPGPLRSMVARFAARRRAPKSREIYRQIGGKSPIVPETEAQAQALESLLGAEVKLFIAMRYWHPSAEFTVEDVKAYAPDEIVLLPLYPQFSTTTTASSTIEWFRAALAAKLNRPTLSVCCYPRAQGLIESECALIRPALEEAARHGRPRLLLSAHGLPKKIVARGDPYQWQVEQTARRIVETLKLAELDWQVCFQSRVGPLAWIEPATDEEIRRAGAAGLPVVLAPISFVSEHSETLVELDIEFRRIAEHSGVPHYVRVPAVGSHAVFIGGLADLVRRARVDWSHARNSMCSGEGNRLCPRAHKGCPLAVA